MFGFRVVLLQLAVQRAQINSERGGRFGAIPAVAFEHGEDVAMLRLRQRQMLVQVSFERIGPDTDLLEHFGR